jgi:release factor glutamine methyltransferase
MINTSFIASDISKKAMAVAKKNSKINKVDKYVKFYHSNLFFNRFLNKKLDLIIANLPYVPYQQKIGKSEGINFEPKNAIFANDNGMEIIKRLIEQAKGHIAPNGLILLETDCRNAKDIKQFAKTHYPDAKIELEKDLAELDRYISISN